MKTLRTCVIDDEPLAAQLISKYVNDTPFLSLAGTYSSAQDAIKTILTGSVDLVFLDINMPQLNGLEFARLIPANCRIVFTTAYDKYAVDGFKVNALDYLLKPIAYEEFLVAATKALNAIHPSAPSGTDVSKDYIIVKSEYRLVQIRLDDILYLEGLKDYVKICFDDGSKNIMTLMNMRTLEQELPQDMFMRVHRSFIVNTTKMRVIERNRIIFGNVQIPVSESYKKEFNEYINNRLVGVNRTESTIE